MEAWPVRELQLFLPTCCWGDYFSQISFFAFNTLLGNLMPEL